MDLDAISLEDLSRFIREKFEKSHLIIEDHTIEDIIGKAEAHPHFTQYFASVVFDLLRGGADQNDESFSGDWMQQILNSQGIIFQNIYDQLSTIQRITAMAVAASDEETELYSAASRKAYGLPASSTLSISLNALVKKDLIYKVKGKYKVNNPVFKAWLNQLPR